MGKGINVHAFERYNEEELKNQKKKRIKRLLLIPLLLIIIKVVFGTIELYNIFGYPENKSRLYDVRINDKGIAAEAFLNKKIPIIPFFVCFNSTYADTNSMTGEEDIWYYTDNSEKYLLTIKSYSCFFKMSNTQTKCNYQNENLVRKENHDIEYTHLYIRKDGRPNRDVYDGDFVNDITEYISEKGRYYVEVTAKYSLIETRISFGIINKGTK